MKIKNKFARTAAVLCTLSVTAALIVSGCGMKASNKNKDFTKKADEYINAINEICTGQKINGNILVAKEGEILLSRGFGKTDYDDNIELTDDTKFLIGSNTKTITAIAIMQLQEKGLLNVNDAVSKYVPEQNRGDKITIEHLLTHTSGIRRDPMVNFQKPVSKEELINKITSTPLDFNPGTQMQYSNCGYNLLAHIIEKVSGQSYEEYLEENIFDPLGMENTGAVPSNTELPYMAEGYYVLGSSLAKVTSTIYDMSVFFGSGNIYSTTRDMYLLDRALYDEKILRKETIGTIYTKGYGCGVGEFKGHRFAAHNGLLDNGYSSTVMRFVDDGLVVIVLMNVSNQDNLNFNIAQVLAAMAMGEDYTLPVKKETISIEDDKLNKLEGDYQLDNGSIITIKREGAYLTIKDSKPQMLLVPYSDNEFFARGSEYRKIKFTADGSGKVMGLVYQECAAAFNAKRVWE